MSIRYPNANYPTAYDEADMVTSADIPVNDAAGNLTVTTAGAGQGPLMESAVTGKDVGGTTLHGDNVSSSGMKADKPKTVVTEAAPAGDDL